MRHATGSPKLPCREAQRRTPGDPPSPGPTPDRKPGLCARQNDMGLDFCGDLAVTMLARDSRCSMFGGGLEFVGAPGLDLVAQRGALAIGDRDLTGRGRATLFRPGFDRDVQE